jgi:hypothetical protein
VVEFGQAVNKLDPDGPAGDIVLYQPHGHQHDGATVARSINTNAMWAAIEQYFAAVTTNHWSSSTQNGALSAHSHEFIDLLAQAGLLTDLGA